jgi:hypothetical protein
LATIVAKNPSKQLPFLPKGRKEPGDRRVSALKRSRGGVWGGVKNLRYSKQL